MSGINLGVLGFAGMMGLSACAYGCGDAGADGPGGGAIDAGDETKDGAPAEDVVDVDVDAGDSDASPDRPGFNGSYSDPGCSVVDIDVAGDRMTGMCGPSINRMFTLDIAAGDPMASADSSISSKSGLGSVPSLDQSCDGDGTIVPAQIVEVSGGHIVPFNVVCPTKPDGVVATVKSGIAFLNAAKQNESTISTIGEAKYGNPGNELKFPLAGMYGAAMVGDTIYIPSSDSLAYGGALVSTAFMSGSNYSVNYKANRVTAFTSGRNSAAMAMLDDTHAMVVNTSGGDTQADSSALANASLDIVDVTSNDSATVKAIGNNRVDLLVPALQPLAELAITADKKYAVVAGGSGDNLSKIIVADINARAVTQDPGAFIDLSTYGEVRGIDLLGTTAYVIMEDVKNPGSSSGRLIMIDFQSPQEPRLIGEPIEIGHDVGSIAVHNSGVVYVSVTDREWEPVSDLDDPQTERWSHIVAIDPAAVSRPPREDSGVGAVEAGDSGGVK